MIEKTKTKICSKCKIEKDLSEFHKNKSRKDGLQCFCKTCRRRTTTVKKENDYLFLFNKGLRRCSLCKTIKPLDAFNQTKDRESGVRSQCKDCLKTYYKKNIKTISKKLKKFRNSPAKYKNLITQLPITDNPKFNKNGFITVDCYFCHKTFTPTRSQIGNRLSSINGNKCGENNFYCSDICKKVCPTYDFKAKLQIDPRSKLYIPKAEAEQARLETKTAYFKKEICDKYGELICEKCGDVGDVELHHTLQVAKFGMKSVNPDSYLFLCPGCHVVLHQECA